MKSMYDGLALFSGGLDSILAIKVLEEQGLRIKGLHFVSPFFGKPAKLDCWRETYGVDLDAVDVGEMFASLLTDGPRFGFGKVLNPCVDCKIAMLRHARMLMSGYGARFLATGEVLGQRPMSQRRDALDIISREAGVRDVLLRPLCARFLPSTIMEESGLVDRERLPAARGRGRHEQLRLAERFGLQEIPTPAGGCKLAEKESARRYWPLLKYLGRPSASDFELSDVGRQLWAGSRWLVVGRNESDNQRMERLARPGDLLFRVSGYPGPLGLGRPYAGCPWTEEAVRSAAGIVASFSPKARSAGGVVTVLVEEGGVSNPVEVAPVKEGPLVWIEPAWETLEADKKTAVGQGSDRLD